MREGCGSQFPLCPIAAVLLPRHPRSHPVIPAKTGTYRLFHQGVLAASPEPYARFPLKPAPAKEGVYKTIGWKKERPA